MGKKPQIVLILRYMKNKILLILVIILLGCLHSIYRHGFDENDVFSPMPYYVEWQEKPKANALFPIGYTPPDISLLFPNEFYPKYWNAIGIKVKNTGNTNLFIYNIGIDIGGKKYIQWDGKDGKEIKPGEEKSFIASFMVDNAGVYSYKIGLYLMAGRNNRWYDWGIVYSEEENELKVTSWGTPTHYKFHKNYYVYFDKIKKLVDPYDSIIVQTANKASSGYGSGYNIAKVCAIFDYIKSNVKYVEDPEGKDMWNSPSTALSEGGDCEEFAMIMASMVIEQGGTARIYLTDNHAFAAIYIGKDLSILNCIDSYYHANLSYALFEDKFGYWIVADTLSSFYLGGLPVGGYPTEKGKKIYEWSIETNRLHAIDVV